MSEAGGLERLESLHRDLLALSELRLLNVERLCVQLEAQIKEFGDLLKKPPRNEQSRKSLATGRLRVFNEEYAINEDFQQGALQLADALDLDELESAAILFEAQDDAETLGRSIVESSIIRFHQRRKYLLDSFRLILQQALDPNIPESIRDFLQDLVQRIVRLPDGGDPGPKFVQKCLQSMGDMKTWLHQLVDKLNVASVLGELQRPEFIETLEYQRVSLIQQHESLGIIVHYLVKASYSTLSSFEDVLDVLRRAEKYDNLLVHHIPAVVAFISVYGPQEGVATLREARNWNHKILLQTEQNTWALHYVHAAVCAWWLAEHSGWYIDNPTGSPLLDVNLDEESKIRSKQFTDALKDGAFDFMLSLSADVKSTEWLDPARQGLRQWLQRKSPPLLLDTVPFSDYFQAVLMEQLESFIDAFITHMPDVLRKLRLEEDEQRQLSLTHDHDLDLERFLVIISFAFEGRPDAAQAFWSDPDSNLAGFLHWASRRTTTPLLSAFCEMLQALSEDEACATKAHEFLLGDATSSSGKMIRSHSLTWGRIFRELTFYSSNIRERPTPPQSTFYRSGKQGNDQAEAEPESAMMLESYLRLMTRLCTESTHARNFLFEHPSFSTTDLLYQLAGSENVPSRLRACAFTTLRSLLSHKTKVRSDFIWKSLDAWVSGSYLQTSLVPRNSTVPPASVGTMDSILQRILAGHEECNAFVQLLNALITPYEDDTGLDDCLPFPESLGSSSRMPGIDPYIDFVGQVFQSKPAEMNDTGQVRLLTLSCLDFFASGLATFNEDLVIFANQSSIVVDNAIKASDLATYVRLHPFSRIMEWVFNDGVMAALFSALQQDVTEVGNASPDSPLVLSLLRAIHVVTLVMDLQATYLDIVRPIIKLQPNHRRTPLANAAFASFEDGVLNNLSIIANLGLYCGAGHAPLTIASLNLLGILSTSSKLVGPPLDGLGRYSGRNKAIVALESNSDYDRIARSLINELLSSLELDEGPESDTYVIKTHVLDFLNACLEAVPSSPTIAHILLGFHCGSDNIEVSDDGQFSRGASLFHAILSLVVEYPIGDQNSGMISWPITLKNKAIQVLRVLWKSPLSSELVMAELRNNNFMINLFLREVVINPGTLWEGRIIESEDFLSSSSSVGLIDFIRHRTSLLQYTALEFRQLSQQHSPVVKERAFLALQGRFTSDGGQQTETPSIFDLFDFMELEIRANDVAPHLFYFKEVDLSVCLETLRDSPATYSPKRITELVSLRHNELRNMNQLPSSKEDAIFEREAQALVISAEIENQSRRLRTSRLNALEAWTQVILMIIETGCLDDVPKISFALQALQVVLPKFEAYSTQALDEAFLLANVAKHLLFSIDFSSHSFQKGDIGDLASDRLFQLFRVCLRAIYSPIANAPLREILYVTCYRYLTGMADVAKSSVLMRKHSTYTIKASGERLMDVICDDAYAGDHTCRITALLFLGALVSLAKQEDSKYVVDSLVRLNFIRLTVDSIQNILVELRECKMEDMALHISYCEAKLALLLHISQTRHGATSVVNAGLFQSVKDSHLFPTDPDLGPGIDNPEAINAHYALLLAIMRVINAAVLSRGEQNEQTLTQGRRFLADNRVSVLTVFKRSVNVSTSDSVVSNRVVDDLAEAYMLLITLTGFISIEDQSNPVSTSMAFT